jgi:hypothetical protein
MREIFARLRDDLGAGAWQAARTMRSSPGYALAVLLTLALCIGANAAVFAVWNALLLRPLPYPDPERLFVLLGTRPGPAGTPDTYVASPLDFVRWKNDSRGFEEIGALWPRDVGLLASGEPETVPAAALSASMFPLLGASPMLGRVFTAEEDRADSRLVVLAHGLWQRRFGADPLVQPDDVHFGIDRKQGGARRGHARPFLRRTPRWPSRHSASLPYGRLALARPQGRSKPRP